MISVAMSAADASAASSLNDRHAFPLAAHRAAEHHRRRWRKLLAQPLEGLAELPGPRARDRIVERDDKARARRGIETPLDHIPRLQIVGERDRAEVMTERRADAGRDGEHRGDARHDRDVEIAPGRLAAVDLLADRGGHGEHARIAAGHQGDLRALRRVAQRRRSAAALLAVVGGVARLARPRRHAIEIGAIAIERVGGFERGRGLRRQHIRAARTEPHDRERAGHGRFSQPGTRMTEKYGAASSRLSSSRMVTDSDVVPRST